MSNVRFQMLFSKGQTLIEVVVALTVIVGLAVALISTSLITHRTARSSRNNTQATRLVQQGIEQIRIFRDRKGFAALNPGDCFVLKVNASGPNDPPDPDPLNWELKPGSVAVCPETITLDNTEFSRGIKIEPDPNDFFNTNKWLVTVVIKWDESGSEMQVSNRTFLVNICQSGLSCP